MTTGRSNPSPRELLLFVLLWPAFCALLGLLAWRRTEAMLHVGMATFVCVLIAAALERETAIRRKFKSLAIPVALFVLWLGGNGSGDEAGGNGGSGVLWVMVALGVLGLSAMLASRPLAIEVHRFWMDAAKPIGWTVSMALLAMVYFLVIMPIGLALRVFGHDPMQRGFDRERTSYWGEHPPPPEARRYYRQY